MILPQTETDIIPERYTLYLHIIMLIQEGRTVQKKKPLASIQFREFLKKKLFFFQIRCVAPAWVSWAGRERGR